jgi:DNA-binding IclR family transcriptional regulator
MAKQHISAALKNFIKEQIQTAPKLEVLLLLHREPSLSFAVVDVAHELGFDTDTAHEQLTALHSLGLVESNPDKTKYRYHPASMVLDSMVDRLAVAYSKQRVPILSAILGEDPNKTRRFVEAFKLARRND